MPRQLLCFPQHLWSGSSLHFVSAFEDAWMTGTAVERMAVRRDVQPLKMWVGHSTLLNASGSFLAKMNLGTMRGLIHVPHSSEKHLDVR